MIVNPVSSRRLTVGELTRFHLPNKDRSRVNEPLHGYRISFPWVVKAIESAIPVTCFHSGDVVDILDSRSYTGQWLFGGFGVVQS